MLRWGVIGVGRAGRARVKALREDPRATVVGGLGGDPAAIELPVFTELPALLDAVDAVAICAPDDVHADLVEDALSAECHVLCEFPLAPDALRARKLFRFARAQQRVLHVEHIELLSPTARYMRGHACVRQVVGGSVRFRGPPRRRMTGIAHANVARLHRLVDVAGLPRKLVVEEREEDSLRGHFPWVGNQQVDFDFALGPETPRKTELTLSFSDGSMLIQFGQTVLAGGAPVSLPKAEPGLFVQDQLACTARILDGALPYVTDERVCEVLALADRLMLVESTEERYRREAGG